jgi:hypothetical protein
MILDINTPNGQITLAHEQEQLAVIRGQHPSWSFVQTPKTLDSDVDGFIVKPDGTAPAMFLSSCRMADRQTMREKWRDEWLLTYDKIHKAVVLAKSLRMSVYGFLYLVPDRLVIVVPLVSKDGSVVAKMRLERTKTQKTCNGGEIVRTNAYIQLAGCSEIGSASLPA